ncbi:MAG TPA: tRNA (adenosine(37)-N6)-threonylcarbamoyltransferase complex transferase subunit TsaD [Chthoniobacterales bacterium]
MDNRKSKIEKQESVILAIETSCDETAIALFSSERGLLASEISSQIPLHRPYGGVVPEVASRNHLEMVEPLISVALEKSGVAISEIEAFAATSGPGLASSLLVGSSVAKGLAISVGKPYLAINHIEGHLLSPFLETPHSIPPNVALVVSGGHTLLVDVAAPGEYHLLGSTVDDAAGEAFDKVAKMLGLPYPGGPEIDRAAKTGDPKRFNFPRSMLHSGDFKFSFSGLKTSVRYLLPTLQPDDLADVCASFQEAVVEVLIAKTVAAAHATGRNLISVSGGVAQNSRLREAMIATGLDVRFAAGKFCADNAAMIAHVAEQKLRRGQFSPLDEEIDPNLKLDWLSGTRVCA